jgi:hypothetical protein
MNAERIREKNKSCWRERVVGGTPTMAGNLGVFVRRVMFVPEEEFLL